MSGRWLLAERHAHNVAKALDLWSESPELSTTENWNLAVGTIDRALELKPLDPEIHTLKGKLYARAYDSPWLVKEELLGIRDFRLTQNAAAKTMADAMRWSAELTPASPYTWVDLASVKMHASQLDDELTLAYSNGLYFGGAIDTVQVYLGRLTAENAYAFYSSPGLKEVMLENLYQALDGSSQTQNRVISALRAENMLELFCAYLKKERLKERMQELCTDQ